jgi:hypothetical protein
MAQELTGLVSIIIGVVFFAIILYVLLVPSSYLPLPAILIGVGSIVSVIVLLVALSRPH